jgi:predicted nucleotidyltransferase
MLLREKDKQTLIEIFDAQQFYMQVWAYGSRVNGKGHSGSDLDLVLRTKDLMPLPYSDYINLCKKIENSNIPILVELRDWARLPKSFHQNIEQQYELLFSN